MPASMRGNGVQTGKDPARTVRRAALMALHCCARRPCLRWRSRSSRPCGAVQPGRNDRPCRRRPASRISISASRRRRARRGPRRGPGDLHPEGPEDHRRQTLPAESFRPLYAGLLGQQVKLSNILDVAMPSRRLTAITAIFWCAPMSRRSGCATASSPSTSSKQDRHVAVEGGTPATQDQVKPTFSPASTARPCAHHHGAQPAFVQRPAGRYRSAY